MKTYQDNERLRLKQASGWFAAGDGFTRAMVSLSDGAFKLFAMLCMRADRYTGQFQASQQELAKTLGKSRRAVGVYVAEMVHKRVCRIARGANQHARTSFEICEEFWPYVRANVCQPSPESKIRPVKSKSKPGGVDADSITSPSYVGSVRASFLAIGCGRGSFSASDERMANQLEKRGVPIEVVEDALLLGSVRKYLSWLGGNQSPPVGSLKYFEPLIQEVQQQPWPGGYREYLRSKHRQFVSDWSKLASRRQSDLQSDQLCGAV